MKVKSKDRNRRGKRGLFFRNIRLLTEIFILLKFTRNPSLKLKSLAEEIEVSKQTVSEYVKQALSNENLKKTDEGFLVTYKGIELIQSTLIEIQDFINDAIEKMTVISTITAIAKTEIKPNEVVGLFMESGVLTAYSGRKSEASGISEHKASIGEDVKISSLYGIIKHEIASISLLKLAERSQDCNFEILNRLLENHKDKKLTVLDLVASVVVKKMGLQIDLIHAPIEASLEAVLKGIPVIALGTASSLTKLINILERYNSTSQIKISYSMLEERRDN